MIIINKVDGCFLSFFFYLNVVKTTELHQCDLPLGMENGDIKDEAIQVSVGSNAGKARLNGDGAWCFKDADVPAGQDVTLTIDLGQQAFVSGVKTQGPPLALKNERYSYQIGIHIEMSSSKDRVQQWITCCGNKNITFYAIDRANESSKVTTHAFGMLILARIIRMRIEMGVFWGGDRERCFRTELLGCAQNLVPLTNLKLVAFPSGWVEAFWDIPTVIISAENGSVSYQMDIKQYNVSLTWFDASLENSPVNSSELSVKVRNVMLPNPVWGARYSLSLVCPYGGKQLPCGNESILATLKSCNPASPTCHEQDQVTFRQPHEITAWTVRPSESVPSTELNNNVYLSWKSEGPGWRTTSTIIKITNETGSEVDRKIINDKNQTALLQNLAGSLFTITFSPLVSTNYPPSFEYKLHVIKWSSLESQSSRGGYGAFITDVKLEQNIQWEGVLVISWSTAKVREKLLKANVVTKLTASNESTEYAATAKSYNVSVMEKDENPSLVFQTISADKQLKLQFPHLKLETVYITNLVIDFGGVILSCGIKSVYTAPPLAIINLDSKIHVYVSRAGGETWSNHKNNCEKGDGTLITLATKNEEDMVRPKLISEVHRNVKSFWIGLNMCLDNKGTIWSDGSNGDHSLLPQIENGLSPTSCCIKAKLSTSDGKFTWNGEPCNSLLPAVCEYKPKGLLGEVTALSRTNATTSSASYAWSYVEEFWTPSEFNHVICRVRDLKTFAEINITNQRCQIQTTSFNKEVLNVSNLEPFSEYNVSVSPYLTSLQYKGKNKSILIRTYHPDPFLMNVLQTGFIASMWTAKVSNFEEEEKVKVTINELPDLKTILSQAMPAKNIKLGGLDLGKQYQVILEETADQKRKQIRNITAYPSCTCEDCQDMGECLTPTDKQVPNSQAILQCQKEGLKVLATSQTPERLDILLTQANKALDDLWVSNTSKKGKGEALVSNGVLQTNTTTNTDCLLVSRSARAIVAASDCKEKHFVACVDKVPLASPFPPLSAMEILVGGTWLRFDWNTKEYGWNTKYTVYYQPVKERLQKREIQYNEYNNAPIIIDGLEKNTAYSVQMIASMGTGFMIESTEIVRTTTSSSACYQSGASASGPLSQMTAGWSPSPEYYLAHLICGTLLIAAALTTMLLFIATGMFYQDCVAQLGFLFSVLLAYLLLLVAHPPYVQDEKIICIVVAVLLHFFFMAAFLFLCLEALTISHLLVEKVQSPFQISNWLLMITGFFVPMIYVSITGGVINTDYVNPPIDNCWLNVSGPVLYVQTVPNGILFILTLLFIGLTCGSNPDNQPILKDSSIRGRQSDTYKLRWVVIALAVELGVAWSAGAAGFHIRKPHSVAAHAIYDSFTILLALTIVIARTSLDDTFRAKVYRLCCGTELTYKRSAIHSISARTRVAPMTNGGSERASSGFSTTTVRTTHRTDVPQLGLPNTPPQSDLSNTILIKRSYKFDDDND